MSRSRPCRLKMPPRWPSSATPASQAPRWEMATFRVSCDHAPLAPAVMTASAHSARKNLAMVASPLLHESHEDCRYGRRGMPPPLPHAIWDERTSFKEACATSCAPLHHHGSISADESAANVRPTNPFLARGSPR